MSKEHTNEWRGWTVLILVALEYSNTAEVYTVVLMRVNLSLEDWFWFVAMDTDDITFVMYMWLYPLCVILGLK